jgi:cell division protein ZapA
MSQTKGVSINILDREFTVSCTDEERPALMDAVHFLDRKMREIRDHGNFVGIERIAIMAALNLSHDLLNSKAGNFNVGDYKRRIAFMQDEIEKACQSK